jgi:hypothetical protein
MKQFSHYIFLQLIAVAILLNVSSCQEFSIDSQGDYPLKIVVDAQPEYTVAAISPRPVVFNVSANTPWTITSNANWCIPFPAMSASSSLIEQITVNIADNESEVPRTATLTISAEGISEKTIVKITQASKSKLLIQPVDDSFPSVGGQLPFTITSNKDWSIVSSNMWLTFDKSSGKGTGQTEIIQAIATPNPGLRRTATVTISNGIDMVSFVVEQEGILLEFAPLENPETDVLFTGDGETKIFAVIANIEWEVETENIWIQLKKIDETHFEVSVPASPLFAPRKGNIKLLPVDRALSFPPVTMEIMQAINFRFNSSSYQILESGAVKIAATGGTSTAITLNPYRYGTFIWKFSEVNLTSGLLDFNFYPQVGDVSFRLYLGGPDPRLTSGGTVAGQSFWQTPVRFSMPYTELNNMRMLKITFAPDMQNVGKSRIEVWVNDNKIVDSGNRLDVYNLDPSLPGTYIHFGFTNQSPSTAGYCVIDSFEIIPYN